MSLPPYKKTQPRVDTPERLVETLRQMSDATDDAFRRLLAVPFLDGVALSEITIETTDTAFDHGLGRQPVGWLFADITSVAGVSRSAWDETTITLVATATWTGSIWVY